MKTNQTKLQDVHKEDNNDNGDKNDNNIDNSIHNNHNKATKKRRRIFVNQNLFPLLFAGLNVVN